MQKVLHAWDVDSFSPRFRPSLDRTASAYPSEDSSSGRSQLAYGACQVLLGVQAVALALFASHVDGSEHAVFHACDALLALLCVVYVVLRCCGYVSPASMPPVCAAFAWALSLLLSLSTKDRRRRILGIEDGGPQGSCEEGSAVFWIALLLSLLPVLAPLPTLPFALLGLLVSSQHLFIGLLLAGQECRSSTGSLGGPTLGLPPLWVSSVQLLIYSLLLVAGQWRSERHRQVESVLSRFINSRPERRGRSSENASPAKAQNRLERIVNVLEEEEQDCQRLVCALDEVLSTRSSSGVWTSLPLHMASMLNRCIGQLKKQTVDGDTATERLFRSMEAGPAQATAVSGWLETSWQPGNFNPRRRRSSVVRSEHQSALESLTTTPEQERMQHQRFTARLTTIDGLAREWGIGTWEFDALQCEQDHRHVLQTVGFEFLRHFAILPRPQLCSFLDRLERKYNGGNPYHSHVHGADMTNALFYLVTKTELWTLAEIAESTRAATIVAALGHDVGHFARNNLFLVSSRHELAVTYNDRSVLENFHSATLARLLDEETSDLDEKGKLFSALSAEHMTKARTLITTLILSSDPQKHLDELSAFRVRIGASSFDPFSDDSDWTMCLSMLFRAADIGHSAKEWRLHQEWSRRVVVEFHAQGDEEKLLGLKVSPLCDREGFQLVSSQVGFLQFICIPTWTEMSQLEARLKDLRQAVTAIREGITSTVSSAYSSRFSDGANVSSPRMATPTRRTSQRSSTMGGTLGKLSSAARTTSQFLLLPGTPASGNKVSPLEATPEPAPAVFRPINDVCLSNCESNRQHWKTTLPSSKTVDSFASAGQPQRFPGTSEREDQVEHSVKSADSEQGDIP